MNADERKPGRGRRGPARACLLAAVLATATTCVAGCGGGGHPGPGAAGDSQAHIVAQLNAYAQCMRTHGLPGFYLSQVNPATQTNPPGAGGGSGLTPFPGYTVTGASASTPKYASANRTCHHLLPTIQKANGSPAQIAQIRHQMVKAAACMRTHGYPDWPDPSVKNGLVMPSFPANVDGNSPQFQKAAKTCGEPLLAG